MKVLKFFILCALSWVKKKKSMICSPVNQFNTLINIILDIKKYFLWNELQSRMACYFDAVCKSLHPCNPKSNRLFESALSLNVDLAYISFYRKTGDLV